MTKFTVIFLPMCGGATVFPDILVPVVGQPKVPSDLIGTTMHVPARLELENHLSWLGANPSFTKHMEVFQGAEAMSRVTSQLQSETGLAMSTDELFQCAQEPSCLQVWTTADALTDKTVRITEILGSWSMSESGVGNVCHVNAKRDVAYCHVPFDAYKSGLSWLAMGVPVDMPLQEPLPVAVRCHDMGPNSQDAPCHLLSGNEFMAARIENMDTRWLASGSEVPVAAANARVVSLGWHPEIEVEGYFASGGMCLDVGGGKSMNGAPVQMWSCLGNDNQKWKSRMLNGYATGGSVSFYGDGQKTHCLDVPGGNFEDGQTVWIWECDSSASQPWEWKDSSGGGLSPGQSQGRISPNAHPELCLERSDSEGGYPFMAICSDSEAQVWQGKRDLLGTELPVAV